MSERREAALAKAQGLAKQVYDVLVEIIEIMDESEQLEAGYSPVESSHGLKVYVKGQESPVSVPDAWVQDWANHCDGDTQFVIGKVRDLGFWSLNNPRKRKLKKNVKSWLATLIAKDYAKQPKRDAGATFDGYEKRNNA